MKQAEQLAAVGGQAAPEGSVLDGAVQLLNLTKQFKQGIGVAIELLRQLLQALKLVRQVVLLGGSEAHISVLTLDGIAAGEVLCIQVVESRDIVRGIRFVHP